MLALVYKNDETFESAKKFALSVGYTIHFDEIVSSIHLVGTTNVKRFYYWVNAAGHTGHYCKDENSAWDQAVYISRLDNNHWYEQMRKNWLSLVNDEFIKNGDSPIF